MGRNHLDLVGKVFGALTVLNRNESLYTTKRGKISRHYIWECQCSCGRKTRAKQWDLLHGKRTACGCRMGQDPTKRWGVDAGFHFILNSYKRHAKVRGLEFDLTDGQFRDLLIKPCFYCGAVGSNKYTPRHNRYVVVYNGVDRVDNSIGYIVENCVPCCGICNRAKRDLTTVEFNSWIGRLAAHVKR